MDTNERALKVREVAGAIANMAPGTMIGHLQMEDLVEADRKDEPGQYYSLVSAVKKALKRDHGIFLKTNMREGYVIARPEENIDLCEGRFIRGIKVQTNAVKECNMIRLDKIKDERKRSETVSRSGQMAAVLMMTRNAFPALKKDSVEDEPKVLVETA